MTSLVLYTAIAIIGYQIGKYMRGRVAVRMSLLQTAVVGVLVFLMGSRIGASEEIIASLGTIGVQAMIYTLIIMAAAVVGFGITRRLLGFDRYGRRKGAAVEQAAFAESQKPQTDIAWPDAPANQGGPDTPAGGNHMTILIISLVVLGLLAGHFILPVAFIEKTGLLLTICLCLLLVVIGIDLGLEGTIVQNFRDAGWRVLIFPAASILSMMVGAVAAAFVLSISVQDSLCIGAGFGWYTLAPAMLATYSAQASALSFLHNVLRELLGVVLIPLVASKVGYFESFSLPGSPSMDVCLPIVEQATSSTIAVYSFINGAVLSASVLVLVSLFMSL